MCIGRQKRTEIIYRIILTFEQAASTLLFFLSVDGHHLGFGIGILSKAHGIGDGEDGKDVKKLHGDDWCLIDLIRQKCSVAVCGERRQVECGSSS